MKVILTYGLPASGKTTWAEEWVLKDPTNRVRVNKDDLRAMLHIGHYSKGNEKQVISIQEEIIKEAIMSGKSIVVDDTNLATNKDGSNKHFNRIRTLVYSGWGYEDIKFELKKFDTSPEECIRRDLKRLNSVGSDVIWRMYWNHIAPQVTIEHNASLSDCIIVDIDGTLAEMHNRHPFQWNKVIDDNCNTHIARLVEYYNNVFEANIEIILMSGRDSVCREDTIQWLNKHQIEYNKLFMRPEGNCEKDTVIKERLYRDNIEGNYNVLLVVDDRPSIIRMWKRLGLPVISANPTTWEF